MGLRINQNIAAMNSYRNLSNTDNQLSKSLEKLSSGFRINRAADDAAGLAISEGLRSQVGGLKVAVRNSQDGISVVQTAEGALNESHSILQRVRDLAVQGANDSNNTEARANIKTESDSLVAELGRIAVSTNFNGTDLLKGNGAGGNLKFQVGAGGDATKDLIEVNLSTANVKAIADTLGAAVSGSNFTVATPTLVAGNYTFTMGTAGNYETVTTAATVGAAGSITTVQGLADKLNSDTNFSAKLNASVDSTNKLVVQDKLGRAVFGGAAGGTHASAGTGSSVSAANASTTGLDYTTTALAQQSIRAIDVQIKQVSTARAGLGALQNRFESTVNTLAVSVENLSASESRIRDADMAQEMVRFTRNQILSQAGTSMLAQANQSSQGVLSLLR
jgi:flagellin